MNKKLAFFTALCLFFSAIEFAIPKPVPFFRLGLSNVPVMLSFFILSPTQSVVLIFLKVFVQNLISGTLLSYAILFSLAGSVSSGLVMLFLYRVLYRRSCESESDAGKKISFVGISLAGSLCNCLSQIGVSYLLIFRNNIEFVAPFMLASSFVTGLLLGIFTEYFVRNSLWLKQVTKEECV